MFLLDQKELIGADLLRAKMLRGGPKRVQGLLVLSAILFVGAKLGGSAISWWWLLLVIPLFVVAVLIDLAILMYWDYPRVIARLERMNEAEEKQLKS